MDQQSARVEREPQQPERVQAQYPVRVQPVGDQPQQPQTVQAQRIQPEQPMIFIQHNMSPDQAPNYQISIPKAPQSNEPCLTISWKANPDGSEPDIPKIYIVNGYMQIMSSHVAGAQH